jgi:serine/threonine protein kinase
MTDELIGKRIGGYDILDVIGRGGMATVYRAHQVSMNRIVALKVLPRQFLNDDTYLQRFNREVKIIAQLEHRNIVPVHDYGEYEGQPYIAMRYMSGGSVDDLLVNGPLALDLIISIISQIAPALDYAHSKRVLHRDIKPSNVLMDDGGGAYLTDFGIARILGESGSLNITQGAVGTPSYMSPEQAQGHEMDGRSDIYALGVMLFEMATGRRPFESETPYSIAVMQVTQQPPAPRGINPSILPAVEQVIYRALSKRRDDRYPNATSLADALRRAASAGSVSEDTEPGGIALRSEPASPQNQAYVPASYYPTPPTSENLPVVRRLRWSWSGNLVLSAIIGAVIGCGLLVLLLVVAMVVVGNTQREEAGPRTVPLLGALTEPPVNVATVSPLPGILEGDLEGRPTSMPESLDTTIAPIGQRETPAARPPEGLPDAEIVYFANRNSDTDLYRMHLSTGVDTRLTTDPRTDMYPQASPDGRQIVFVSDRDGDWDLYLIESDGSNVRQLTRNTVTDRIPSWSPDGDWIVFSSDTRGDGSHDIYQIRPDGTDLRPVYSDGLRNSHPRWSIDDRYLVFTNGTPNEGETWEIMRFDRRSSESVLLTNNLVRDWSPVLTPDGERILYLTSGEGEAAFALMSLEGDDFRILYDGPGYEWGGLYSPDMRFLLFTSDATGVDELYVRNNVTGEVLQVTTDGGSYASWLSYNR